MRSGATALRLHPYPTPGLRERAATETAPETGARTGALAWPPGIHLPIHMLRRPRGRARMTFSPVRLSVGTPAPARTRSHE